MFNKLLLESNLTKHLYYLAPILTGLLLIFTQRILINKTNSFIKILLSTLVNLYIIVSLIFMMSNPCETDKNLNNTHIIILGMVMSATIWLHIKNLYKFNKKEIVLLSIATVIAFIEMYYTLYTYNLFYQID